jgi:type IV pilus assembly protein PilO
VTLNNLVVGPPKDGVTAKDGVLAMDAIAKTFRYLDADEVAAQRKAVADGAKK